MEALAAQPFTPEHQFQRPNLHGVRDPSPAEALGATGVHAVMDAEFEAQSQERYQRWLGSVALQQEGVVVAEQEPDATDLLDTIREARKGSPEAKRRLSINVATATAEGFFKDNHVSTIITRRNRSGKLGQHGQAVVDSVHRNAMTERPNRHPMLQEITKAEALNAHRIEDALQAGKLKDHYLVVWSVVPQGVPKKDLGEGGDGYFLEDLTMCIQATTELDNGDVQTQAGFKAGVEAEPGDTFEDRQAKRFDFAALTRLYRRFGQKPPTIAVGFLQGGLYIPKAQMPNGVVDAMRWTDEEADAVLGRNIERKTEDYMAIYLESKRREASIKDVRQRVEQELLADYSLQTPMQASGRMWELIKDRGVEASLENKYIEPKVFGAAAAPHIMEARRLAESGMVYQVQAHMQEALEAGVVTGCGGGATSSESDGTSEGVEGSWTRDKYGSRKFTCSNGHLNIRPEKDKLIPKCQHEGCKAVVAC